MSKLITTSLISSIQWLNNAPPSWQESAYTQLKNSLARKPWDPSPEIKRGIDFENKVYSCLKRQLFNIGSEDFQWFVNESKGGTVQYKTKSFMTVNGVEYCLYGKLDLKFPNVIKDIKTTSNYKEQKYMESSQHIIYCHNEQIEDFEYLVAVFEKGKPENKKMLSKHKIEIKVDLNKTEEMIIGYIKLVNDTLKTYDELRPLYDNVFNRF